MIRRVDKSELAYTAGIIDGEGCINLSRSKSKKCKNGYTVQLLVAVGNTNEWLIQWLHFRYGGHMQYHKEMKLRWKDKWIWQIKCRQASSFLELILPYLKIKRPQAELGIAFQQAKKWCSSKTSGAKAIEEAQLILMHKFNKRGKQGDEA